MRVKPVIRKFGIVREIMAIHFQLEWRLKCGTKCVFQHLEYACSAVIGKEVVVVVHVFGFCIVLEVDGQRQLLMGGEEPFCFCKAALRCNKKFHEGIEPENGEVKVEVAGKGLCYEVVAGEVECAIVEYDIAPIICAAAIYDAYGNMAQAFQRMCAGAKCEQADAHVRAGFVLIGLCMRADT